VEFVAKQKRITKVLRIFLVRIEDQSVKWATYHSGLLMSQEKPE